MMQIPYMVCRGRASPLVTTKLSVDDKSITTLAYVNTGATHSVYNSDFCDRLVCDLLKGERIDITVGDGGIIPVYLHEIKVEIEEMKFQAKIGFSDRMGTGINILGRETVLDEFVVCFDGKMKEIRWE
jgi:hypothetical protein